MMNKSGRTNCAGFTLIEIIAVVVVLSTLAVLGTKFAVTAAKSYENVRVSHRLVNTARQAIERISRQVRVAHPYSLRLVNSGSCLEYMPIVGSGNYFTAVADSYNGVAPSASLTVSPHSIDNGTAAYLSIGAMSSAELYGSVPASRATISNWATTLISLSSAKRWQRNSLAQRFYVLDNPQAICVVGSELRHYPNVDATTVSVDTSASYSLLAENISVVNPFALTSASDNRNVNVQFSINVIYKTQSVTFNHSVMVRNVP